MKRKILIAIAFFLLIAGVVTAAQKKKTVIRTDIPLHLTQPDYKVPYGVVTPQEVKEVTDRVLRYLERDELNKERGVIPMTSYEAGVIYQSMLIASRATGDTAYAYYTNSRFRTLEQQFPLCQKELYNKGEIDSQMFPVVNPRSLDDAGSMATAMMKARQADREGMSGLGAMIDNYFNYIEYKQDRLSDGTFCRQRPQRNSVWLDDMFMSVPAILNYAKIKDETRDDPTRFYTDAVRQITQMADRLFDGDKHLFRHAWVEGMTDHPSFYWARANGWGILSLCEALDKLPSDYIGRDRILQIYKEQVRALAELQDGDGFWHQLLNRTESYQETSATAIFTYALAHGINKGWIDGQAYGPIALQGWHAVASKVNIQGEVEGTCVGTGMAFDAAYYMHRPVSVLAVHGYGPTIMAGAEIISMLKHQHPRMNDSAVQFYKESAATVNGGSIFSIADPTHGEEFTSGSSRLNAKAPVVFICGDSTVKNGRGKGDGDMWGWGSFFQQFLDSTRITAENHALGGRSSRTYYSEGLWDKVLSGIKKGDFVLIQFGHNDGGPLNIGRARASLNGSDERNEVVIMEKNGGPETVYTFGHYIRLFARQAKLKGATVIILSYTPDNKWKDNHMRRCTDTYAAWSQAVAREEGVYYIDENEIAAQNFEKLGKEAAQNLYKDSVHTTYGGAIINCQSIIDGLKAQPSCPLNGYIK